MIRFGTKSETLDHLSKVIQGANILPQIRFTVEEWKYNSRDVIHRFLEKQWNSIEVIVRSSALAEDHSNQSLAGKFESVPHVRGIDQLVQAVNQVIQSYGHASSMDQIFIQPMLTKVSMAGVAFSRDPNTGAPYIIINYDDRSGTTNSVTAGSSNELKTFYSYKQPPHPFDYGEKINKIIALIHELEHLFNHTSLDIEFAYETGTLYLFQVRPLIISKPQTELDLSKYLLDIESKVRAFNKPHPYLHGNKTVFGIMPDWNPAEIIGVKPRPLALSLYKEIVTDSIWAYQRDNYGYKNLRSFPLLIDFYGLPYIDVRVSFNSFLPSETPGELSDKLVNYYIDRLIESPNKHDKVEFDIIFSCYTFDLPERLEKLLAYGFTASELQLFKELLRELTNKIIHKDGLWKNDIDKINLLRKRNQIIMESDLDKIGKIYWLLEDCKRYGTLPFAGLARAGFIAIQLLQSLIHVGIISKEEYSLFLNSLNTISTQMSIDFRTKSKAEFLEKYGHLRPGTYDLLSPRYDEEPDTYFAWDEPQPVLHQSNTFS